MRPLRSLASSLERLAGGDLDTPFPEPGRRDEIGMMLVAFERTRITLRTSLRNFVRSTAAQQRLANELAVARAIQESMLPEIFPALPDVDVCAHIDMAREVCGDLYDCFVSDAAPQRLCCVMGNVCGKGIPAALIMNRIMSLARAALLRGLSPARTLEWVNAALLRHNASPMFVTMLVGVLDGTTGRFLGPARVIRRPCSVPRPAWTPRRKCRPGPENWFSVCA